MEDRRYRFYHPIAVRYADTDGQGHVFYGNYLTYFDEAGSGYFRAIGCPWQKMQEMGLDIFYVDAHCQYHGSALFEDLLHVHATMARIGNSSLTINCGAYRAADGQLIASGEVTAVLIDMKSRKPTRVPDVIRQAVADFEAAGE